MTNETIGTVSVFVFTGFLFLLRYLILTEGKPGRKPSLTKSAEAVKRGLRPVDSRYVQERERSDNEGATSQVHPRLFLNRNNGR